MTIPHQGFFSAMLINNQINIQIKHNWVKNPNWPEAKPVGYLQDKEKYG